MTFAILTIIITLMSLFIASALRRIDSLTRRVEEIEWDLTHGNM